MNKMVLFLGSVLIGAALGSGLVRLCEISSECRQPDTDWEESISFQKMYE
jgi:hypothetical protein